MIWTDMPRILNHPEASASENDMFYCKLKHSITVYASFLYPRYTISDPWSAIISQISITYYASLSTRTRNGSFWSGSSTANLLGIILTSIQTPPISNIDLVNSNFQTFEARLVFVDDLPRHVDPSTLSRESIVFALFKVIDS